MLASMLLQEYLKYEVDLEKEKEKHKLEIDKLELEHKHQLEFSQGMNAAGNRRR